MMNKIKIIIAADLLFIIIMVILCIWENTRSLTGLSALSGVGRFVVYLVALGAAILLLVILCAVLIYKKFKG